MLNVNAMLTVSSDIYPWRLRGTWKREGGIASMKTVKVLACPLLVTKQAQDTATFICTTVVKRRLHVCAWDGQ